MAGMDIRILAGVFITLFGIAIAMSGGEVDSNDIWGQIGSFSADDLSDVTDWNLVSALFPEPGPKPANTSISADLTTTHADISVGEPATVRLKIDQQTPLTVGDSQITPGDNDTTAVTVILRKFTGTFSTTDTVALDGTIHRIETDGLSMNYTSPTSLSLEDAAIDSLQLIGVKHQEVAFDTASGNISTGGSDIALRNESAVFEFFEGEIALTALDQGYRYRLAGDVFRGRIQDKDSTITIGGETR